MPSLGVGIDVGVADGLTAEIRGVLVGAMVGGAAVGSPAVALGGGSGSATSSVACRPGANPQMYSNLPDSKNCRTTVCFGSIGPVSQEPSAAVAVCCFLSSFVQATYCPEYMRTVCGWKPFLSIVTAIGVGDGAGVLVGAGEGAALGFAGNRSRTENKDSVSAIRLPTGTADKTVYPPIIDVLH